MLASASAKLEWIRRQSQSVLHLRKRFPLWGKRKLWKALVCEGLHLARLKSNTATKDGQSCGQNRVYRIMRSADLSSMRGYKRHRSSKGGQINHVAPNTLERPFEYDRLNKGWVTDFTYIRTHEG
ncbi:MAG: hypothetical protein A6F72_06965 [Cycloclasticus sp. symbiont of Poecilosclerida sp. N]|nr:MAG: hypothetical protein A6F72_06965 [Cycloclasticus sp. symbiont of Poecilosclerida sp. N]